MYVSWWCKYVHIASVVWQVILTLMLSLLPQANPDPSCCLGVFGLSLYTTERDLREVFSKYGPLADVNIVYDQQSRRSRGFAFVYFETSDDAKEVKLKQKIMFRSFCCQKRFKQNFPQWIMYVGDINIKHIMFNCVLG